MSDSPATSGHETLTRKRQIFLGLRLKLILVFVLLFFIIDAIVFSWFYTFSTSVAQTRIDSELEIILSGTVKQIDGDNFELLAKQVELEMRSQGELTGEYPEKAANPMYWNHIREIAQVKDFQTDPRRKDKNGAPWSWAKLYTFVKGKNEHEIVFIGSSSAPERGAKFKEVCTDAPDDCTDLTTNYQALDGQNLVIQKGVYTDDFGSWHSGYQPIRNSQGKVVGALGVDFQAEYLDVVRNEVTRGLVVASIFTFFALLTLVWVASGIITRPLTTLTIVADEISQGKYEQDLTELIKKRFQDEVGRLAYAINHMILRVKESHDELEEKVKSRTHELNQKVEELQRLNTVMTDREIKMVELKKEIDELKEQLHKK